MPRYQSDHDRAAEQQQCAARKAQLHREWERRQADDKFVSSYMKAASHPDEREKEEREKRPRHSKLAQKLFGDRDARSLDEVVDRLKHHYGCTECTVMSVGGTQKMRLTFDDYKQITRFLEKGKKYKPTQNFTYDRKEPHILLTETSGEAFFKCFLSAQTGVYQQLVDQSLAARARVTVSDNDAAVRWKADDSSSRHHP